VLSSVKQWRIYFIRQLWKSKEVTIKNFAQVNSKWFHLLSLLWSWHRWPFYYLKILHFSCYHLIKLSHHTFLLLRLSSKAGCSDSYLRIPATQEVETGRIMVQGQPRQKVSETLSLITSQTWCFLLVIPAMQEVYVVRSQSKATLGKKQYETLFENN
jgi:hypothetical protein